MRLLVYLVMAVGLSACGSDQDTLPDGVIGVWKTKTRKYRDRAFELQPDKVIFETGEETAETNILLSVEAREEDGRLLYDIDYLSSDGLEHTFSFYYNPMAGGVIALKNQSGIVWRKERRTKK